MAGDGGHRSGQRLGWKVRSRALGTCRAIVQSEDTHLMCGYPGVASAVYLACMTDPASDMVAGQSEIVGD